MGPQTVEYVFSFLTVFSFPFSTLPSLDSVCIILSTPVIQPSPWWKTFALLIWFLSTHHYSALSKAPLILWGNPSSRSVAVVWAGIIPSPRTRWEHQLEPRVRDSFNPLIHSVWFGTDMWLPLGQWKSSSGFLCNCLEDWSPLYFWTLSGPGMSWKISGAILLPQKKANVEKSRAERLLGGSNPHDHFWIPGWREWDQKGRQKPDHAEHCKPTKVLEFHPVLSWRAEITKVFL